MTIIPALWPRQVPISVAEKRLFRVAPDSQILGHHHFNAENKSGKTLIIVHGLEGSADSSYLLGMCYKAIQAGLNVVRLNLRNCGNTMKLTPTLYNAGLSGDIIAVAKELRDVDGVTSIFTAGYSLGGNIVLKAAAELGEAGSSVFAGVCTISPSLDLPTSVVALESGFNRLYETRFLFSLKAKVRAKHALFPELYDISNISNITRIRDFDDRYSCRDAGYATAAEYYEKASALPMMPAVRVPTLIITSQDDPIVPFRSFQSELLQSPYITIVAPEHGGHAGFMGSSFEGTGAWRDRFWAENRVVEFCVGHG